MQWISFIRILHVIGTALGVGGITYAELVSTRLTLEDSSRKSLFRLFNLCIRIGTVILVVSGFGYLLYYRLTGRYEALYSPRLWAKYMIVLMIVINALLLQTNTIPRWLGRSISLLSWYWVLILGTWRTLEPSFFTVITIYLGSICVAGLIFKRLENS